MGRHFVQVQVKKNFRMLLHLRFVHNVTLGVTNSRAARSDDEHCRFSRLQKSRELSGTLLRSRWEMSLQSESLSWVTVELFRQLLPNLRIPQQAVQETEAATSPAHVSRGHSAGNHEECGGKALGLPDVDPLLASLSQRITIEEDEDVNRYRSAKPNRSPDSQQVSGRQLLPKPHRHGATARSSAITNRCHGRESCQPGRKPYAYCAVLTPCSRRLPWLMKLRN